MIRGNSGIFYDTLESSLINRESNFGPVGQAAIDLRQGDPLFPAFPNRLTAFPTGSAAVPRATVTVPVYQGDDFPFSIGDTLQRTAPYFFNSTIGFQQELGPNWAMSADYVHVRAYDLIVTLDLNAPPYFPLGPGQTRTVAQANLLRPYGVPNRTGGPYNIQFTGFRDLQLQINGGETQYDALKLGVVRRASSLYEIRVNYTYSKARGDTDNFRLTESFVPGLADIDGDRSYQQGPSAQDVPHYLTVSGYLRAPWGINVGGILTSRSGFPYTGVVGIDADGDGVTGGAFGDRPAALTPQLVPLPEPDDAGPQRVEAVHADRLESHRAARGSLQRHQLQGGHPGEQHHRPGCEQPAGDVRAGHQPAWARSKDSCQSAIGSSSGRRRSGVAGEPTQALPAVPW